MDSDSSAGKESSGEARRGRFALIAGFSGAAVGAIAIAVLNPAAEHFTNKALNRLDAPQALIARETWPSEAGCDSRTVVGTSTDSAPEVTWQDYPDELPDNVGRQVARDDLLKAEGGPIGVGFLTLWLTASDDKPLYVTAIDVAVFERSASPARWAIPVDGQCGGDDYERNFFLDFNAGTPQLVDMGPPEFAQESEDRVPTESFGKSFTITQEVPTRIKVTASSCAETVRWGLAIHYFSGGQDRTLLVGDEAQPFTIYAGSSQAQMLSSQSSPAPLAAPICFTRETIDQMWDRSYLPDLPG